MAEQSSSTIPIEEWRPVEGWPYEVSSLGRVRRTKGGRGTRKNRDIGSLCKKGSYVSVALQNDLVIRRAFVHRLVCEAFHGPAPSPQHQVAHADGNGTNNAASNLRWATSKENHADRFRHGTAAQGVRNGRAKLTEADVRQIRQLGVEGVFHYRIGARFGITQAMTSRIIKRTAWATVD